MIKKAEFPNKLAYTSWLQAQGSNITVVSQSGLIQDFGYEASARLERPKIIIEYVDFRED